MESLDLEAALAKVKWKASSGPSYCAEAPPYEYGDVELGKWNWHGFVRHAATKELLYRVGPMNSQRMVYSRVHQWLNEKLAVDAAYGRPWAKPKG